MKQISNIILCLLFYYSACPAIDRRSRAEGIPGITASNTVGPGNIIFSAGVQSYFETDTLFLSSIYERMGEEYGQEFEAPDSLNETYIARRFLLLPEINGTVGLTSFFHLSLSTIPWTGYKIGNSNAGLNFTIPGNDNLRVLGLGGSLNVTLTSEDNVSAAQKPTLTFRPIFSFTAIADIDLIKIFPEIPLKIYLNYSTLDNVKYQRQYQQHSVITGIELKEETYSAYIKLGGAVYQDRSSGNLLTPLTLAGFGYKKRFTGQWPFTLAGDMEFDPVHPVSFMEKSIYRSPKIFILFSMPVFFKETNTEAFRTLAFMERSRKKGRLSQNTQESKNIGADITFDQLLSEFRQRDLLDDKLLNEIFVDEKLLKQLDNRKKIIEELKDKDKNIDK